MSFAYYLVKNGDGLTMAHHQKSSTDELELMHAELASRVYT